MNLSSLTEEKSVSDEQRVKSNEQRSEEQRCEDIREHLKGDIYRYIDMYHGTLVPWYHGTTVRWYRVKTTHRAFSESGPSA